MNGVHDMGGMHGMGPVVHEKDEPVFHEGWEGRVYALTLLVRAGGGRWNIDAGRYEIERIPPAEYLRMSYYERWAVRLADSGRQSGPRDAGGDRQRRAGCRIGESDAAANAGEGAGDGCTPRFHKTRGPCSRHLQIRTASPRPQYPSDRSYAPAAIRAWQARNGRRRSWRVRVP